MAAILHHDRFTVTLIDRLAEVSIGATVLMWALLSLRSIGVKREAAPR